MTRTEFLRKNARDHAHKAARVAMPESFSAVDYPGTIAERKAHAMELLFDSMPLYIGEQELIVGSRTMYRHRNEFLDTSDMNIECLPHYVSEADTKEFDGFNGESLSKSHYVPDFSRILRLGIDGIVETAKEHMAAQPSELKKGWLNSVVISYEAISRWILRYAAYAKELAEGEAHPTRRAELERIAEVCSHIAHKPPRDFYEAAQLFWFSSLSTIVENFRWVCYGRVDQVLYPYYSTLPEEEVSQLTDCLLIKMYDGADLRMEYFGEHSGQLNITLGGVTPEGADAVNGLTYMFLDALDRVRLPEPEVACRIHSLNPPEFLERCAALSVDGVNNIAYYNDDQFIGSMIGVGIAPEAARDYGFDLCQDINIPGKSDFSLAGFVDFAPTILNTMRRVDDSCTFEEFVAEYRKVIAEGIAAAMETYNLKEKAVREYVAGNHDFLREQVKAGKLSWYDAYCLMSPLPITSALYDNCLESGTDVTWFGCPIADRGFLVFNPVVGINSLAALRKRVFEEKRYTVSEVLDACDHNFEGQEKMRQMLWSAPKWSNDDDFVDLPAKELLEFACDEILKYRTPTGARHLAGIHQPHPVATGWGIPATPEGRKAGTPVPVTLSPENGTMLSGPTAALASAAKVDYMRYQWNFCVMLQYFASAFQANEGPKLFADMLRSYFAMGGGQHQPNVVNVEDLKDAQVHPEQYRDLIIRMWGVSAHFVDMTKEVQDEFIARFENM